MHTDSRLASSSTTAALSTTAAHRRRRHLSVYRRALQSAHTPEQRAAVAARYRQLFTMDAEPAATLTLAPELVSTGSVEVPALAVSATSPVSTGSVEKFTVTVAA